MQIRRILKPCVSCGESLIFGHFAPEGDVLKLNEGWSRVLCPTCQNLGPVRSSFRDACESWNALARPGQPRPATDSDDAVEQRPLVFAGRGGWAAPSGSTTRPGATRQG